MEHVYRLIRDILTNHHKRSNVGLDLKKILELSWNNFSVYDGILNGRSTSTLYVETLYLTFRNELPLNVL